MKDKVRQIAGVVSILLTIVVNTLANALPINGQNTGEISDRFDVYFTPAGYVFSIWGLIYLGLIAYAIYQALPAQRENPRMRAIGWWVVIGSLANTVWIFLWHYEVFPLTLVAMLLLLVTLIITYLKLGVNKVQVSKGEKWAVHLPFSIYLGWITVATVANIAALLDYLEWNAWGISEVAWMWIILAAVLVIALLMNFTRRDVGYALVILWAVAGIAVKHSGVTSVVVPAWITFAVVAISLVALLLRRRSA
jgi:hypothetical protein